jgi:hypothetical protein
MEPRRSNGFQVSFAWLGLPVQAKLAQAVAIFFRIPSCYKNPVTGE